MTADRRDDLLVLLAAALPLALLLVRERVMAGSAGFPLDDSWIHLHFARNLAEGAGFAYNPGVPVAGSTAPLWTLLLAAGARVAGASMIMTKRRSACSISSRNTGVCRSTGPKSCCDASSRSTVRPSPLT